MNAYAEMKKRHQAEISSFPMAFAFDRNQLVEAMKKLGLNPDETDKVCSLYGAGDIIRKSDVPTYKEMLLRHHRELRALIEADRTGNGFIFEMFDFELRNHEYGYTEDASDTLEALGISWDDLEKDARLMCGFQKACKIQAV